jgi:ABC-type transporter Mla subunit MlaD
MKTMTVGKRIGAGAAVLVLQALAVAGFSHWMMVQTSDRLKLVSAQYLPVTELATQVEREVLNARIHFIYFVTIQKTGSLEKGWDRFRKAQKGLADLQNLIERSDALTDTRSEVAQLRHDFDSYEPVLERIIAVVNQHQNHGPEFDALIVEWARLGGAMVDSAGRLSRLGSQRTNESATQADTQLGRAIATVSGASLAGFLFGVTIMFFVVRGINRVLTHAVTELSGGADQVSSASGQVSSSSQSLAQGASEQAASLEETSASSEQMASMTRKNAENSQQAAQFMNAVSQRVGEANHTLDAMMTSMREIDVSSGKISKIIKVIDEIAFQTNILALNAAVEAARAGEAGMGFAVVADEVRNLAQRSAQAAKDTAILIEDSILKSGEGSKKLGGVVASIRAITEGAGKVKTLVDQMDASNREQAQAIGQISKAVAQIDEVTQRTAANAEESASASEELHAQSQALIAVVEQLQGLVGGGSGSSAVSKESIVTKRPPVERPAQKPRRLPAASSWGAPVPVAVRARNRAKFPLDASEFKEF